MSAESIQPLDDRVGAAAGAAGEVRTGCLGLLNEAAERGEQPLGDVDLVGVGGQVLDAPGDDEPLFGLRGESRTLLEDAPIAADRGIDSYGELIIGRIE